MGDSAKSMLAGILGGVIGFAVGCLGTCSFNVFILGCNPNAEILEPNDPAKERTAQIIWYVGIVLGPLVGAVLAIRYVRRPKGPP